MDECQIPNLYRLIAFYLPQYHPIPENDAWWGKGFTEWVNVAKARPLFKDHYQPHIPADLGFYDLRLPEVRQAQADLAKQHGIFGFCYYHYWFEGKRLLGEIFDEVLSSRKPDFPFCLCWANENWSRAWDGKDGEILIEQKYSNDDDINHIHWLFNAFRDDRYIKIDGKPVFLIYRPARLPNPRKMIELWRSEAIKIGIGDLYICGIESPNEKKVNSENFGFDAAVEFGPFNLDLGRALRHHRIWRLLGRLGLINKVYYKHAIFDYSSVVDKNILNGPISYKRFPAVTPSWDNSPRRKNGGIIFKNSTPELYEHWLRHVVDNFNPPTPNENLIFINAWNEWGEGNHLEPCQKWGKSYLEATLRAITTKS